MVCAPSNEAADGIADCICQLNSKFDLKCKTLRVLARSREHKKLRFSESEGVCMIVTVKMQRYSLFFIWLQIFTPGSINIFMKKFENLHVGWVMKKYLPLFAVRFVFWKSAVCYEIPIIYFQLCEHFRNVSQPKSFAYDL